MSAGDAVELILLKPLIEPLIKELGGRNRDGHLSGAVDDRRGGGYGEDRSDEMTWRSERHKRPIVSQTGGYPCVSY